MKNLATIFIFIFSINIAGATPDWKLKKDTKNIKVYSAATENSNYNQVKVECTLNGTITKVIAALFDIDRQKEWVFNDKYSRLLKKVAENELIYYSEVSVPWPCANRDFIAHLKVTQSADGIVTIESHAEPAYYPQQSGLVRIHSSHASWKLTNIGAGQVSIEYIVQFDPAGAVPAWLTNLFVTKGPYETFVKLQDRVNLTAYQHLVYSFIK